MTRARILFVDDEVAVLDGLRDLLRKERGRWEMVFAVGGEKALAELQKATFDIVVTDMRMPGMDGAELLAKVKANYPSTARLVLSGHSEREATLRALKVAHQFLSKPCDADQLRTSIERTYGLHKLLESEATRSVAGMAKLPSVARVYHELVQAASDPSSNIQDIAAIVQQDPAMSAKMLQLVNSAYFGNSQTVVSISQAVGNLGVELMRALALTADAFTAVEARPTENFSLDRLQTHSILTARLAKSFLPDPKQAEEAFTAGLVHDVGKIVVALGFPDRLAELAAGVQASRRPAHLVEAEMFGASHAELGAYMLGVWGLPFSIVEFTAYHHRPGLVPAGPLDVLAAVHVADVLSHSLSEEGTREDFETPIDLEFLERSGHTADLPRWREIAEQEALRIHGAARR